MKNRIFSTCTYLFLLFNACISVEEEQIPKPAVSVYEPFELTLAQANSIAELPLHCVQQEFPNKLGQVLGSGEDLATPKSLHPSFYGCFDWHSAVHGHWSMVKLLQRYPDLDGAERIKRILTENLSKENIEQEVAYFDNKHNRNYERTYGWGWLLKLAEELHHSQDPLALELEQNLKPLTELIAKKMTDYLPKLV